MDLPQMTAKEYAEAIWNALNADNKVSLFVRYVDLTDGSIQQTIRNKF